MSERSPVVVRLVKGFGRFWWDFLVGDTPEIFIAVVVIIGVTALLSEAGHFNVAVIVVLPVIVLLALWWSLRRATHASRRR
ncbi:MAG: hypothetical protein WCF25_03250 [Acidimicrobiales bacterium]